MLIEFSLILVALTAGSTAMFCKGDLLGGSFCAVILSGFLLSLVISEIKEYRKGAK